MTDPLGLSPEQRTKSNLYAGLSRREVWWPPEADRRVEEHVREDACELCRTIDGHAPRLPQSACPAAEEEGLELDMKLVERGAA